MSAVRLLGARSGWGRAGRALGDPSFEKEAWLSLALLEWGSVGRIAYVDDVPAGYVSYAPPHLVPRSVAFPTAPVSGDAVLLMTARVLPEFTGGGLARMLVQSAAKDLTRRGVRAIEAYGLELRRRRRAIATPRSPAASCPPSCCGRWVSRRCGRTTATRGCGSS